MLRERRATQPKKGASYNGQSTLYAVVFDSVSVKWSVFLLLSFLLLQPVASAFAAEDEPQSTEVPFETSGMLSSTSVSEPSTSEPGSAGEGSGQDNGQEMEVSEVVLADLEKSSGQIETDLVFEENETSSVETDTSEQEAAPVDEQVQENEQAISPATSTPETKNTVPEISASTTEMESSTTTDSLPSGETADEGGSASPESVTDTDPDPAVLESIEEAIESTDEEPATSTLASTTEPIRVIHNNENTFQFNDTECTAVGEGAFYCNDTARLGEFLEDGVFAAPDADGDNEIFVRLEGEARQLTFNEVNDEAPFYDARSKRIVWHALHNERYQIMSYDMHSGDIEQLTHTTYNNMEPVAYEDITLWQAWIDNNWEIVEFKNGELVQLTDNEFHDVSPSVRDGHVIWQTQFSDGWRIAVYDMDTSHIDYIEKTDNALIENPRLVLVYDTKSDNGDRQTLGYDFESRSTFALGHLPAELPDELPEPDDTGETRALVQSKPSVREGESEVIDGAAPNTSAPTGSTTPQIASEPGTLIVFGPKATAIASSSLPATATTTQIIDLVIPPLTEAGENASSTEITDLIIPAATSSVSEETL